MKNQQTRALTIFCCLSFLYSVSWSQTQPPNVLVIMADDLGYSDLGCYGGEIKTPNLDALATNGLRFSQFYNTGRCWPTRAALLTGYYPQQVRRDKMPGIPDGGGGGKRPDWAPLLPQLLQPAGYRSYHSGKWHIDGKPIENGFDRSYLLLDQGRFFNPQRHFLDDEKLAPIAPESGYYASTAIADHAIECLKEHDQKFKDRPFFHFLAFTAPHFPLHALPEDIAMYEQTYRKDWEKIRRQRYRNLKHIGLINSPLAPVERNIGPPYDFPDHLKILGPNEVNRPYQWSDLTRDQRDFQASKMAIHAAMITRMDIEIGRVINQLKQMGVLENTLILFLSDNGASAEIMVRDDGHDPAAHMGSAATYLCLGPGGSTNSNTPFRRHKTWVHEGGIATPLIAHWPKGIRDPGNIRHQTGHVIDLVPTVIQLANANSSTQATPSIVVPKRPGQSLLPIFNNDQNHQKELIWWYHEGNRALRYGDWKIVSAAEAFSMRKGVYNILHGPWELYDLKHDRTEVNDLAGQRPEKLKELVAIWEAKAIAFRADSRPSSIRKNWDPAFVEIEIASSKDDHIQRAMFRATEAAEPKPLLVGLHTWSGDYTQKDTLSFMALEKDWNYIHPNFRGPNRTVDACCSELALADIDDAIDYALQNGMVDPAQIYVAGASGGGYASLAVYMKSRHKIRKISSWVPISDLIAWHQQSTIRGNKYAEEIAICTHSVGTLNEAIARAKSPLFWECPERDTKLEIYAGVYDGLTGSVPFTQSINFYNKLVRDLGGQADKLVEDSERLYLLEHRKPLGSMGNIGDRAICLQKNFGNITLTIFEGGHEMLPQVAFDRLHR